MSSQRRCRWFFTQPTTTLTPCDSTLSHYPPLALPTAEFCCPFDRLEFVAAPAPPAPDGRRALTVVRVYREGQPPEGRRAPAAELAIGSLQEPVAAAAAAAGVGVGENRRGSWVGASEEGSRPLGGTLPSDGSPRWAEPVPLVSGRPTLSAR